MATMKDENTISQKPGVAGGTASGGTASGQNTVPTKAAVGTGTVSAQNTVPTKTEDTIASGQTDASLKPGGAQTGTGASGTSAGSTGTTTTTGAAAANTNSYADLINNQYDNMWQQTQLGIDRQTQQSVDEAVRGYEDSVPTYADAYRQATIDQYNGADNAALNARMSGQYGGMATANVNAIQSQYQQQRAKIAQEQQQLAEQTVRQVADLRAQGEFQKADQLLQQSQQRFQQLYEDAVRVDENTYSNWQYQNTMDREDAEIARQEAQTEKEYQQSLGLTLLKMGVMPDETILEALGISSSTAKQYINMVLYGYA